MYVTTREGTMYVTTREGTTKIKCCKGSSTSTFRNTTVTVDGTSYTTDSSGYIYLPSNHGVTRYLTFEASGYKAKARIVFGQENTVILQQGKLTVDTSSCKYASYFTFTTKVDSTTYTGSFTNKVVSFGATVTVTATGSTTNDYQYYGSQVIVDGVNTNKTTYTFTVTGDHTITFTDGSMIYVGQGT